MVRKTYKKHDVTISSPNDDSKDISRDVFLAEDTHSEDGMLGFEVFDNIISGGILTVTDTSNNVKGEGDAVDTVDFIDIGTLPDVNAGDIIILQEDSNTITLKHNASGGDSQFFPMLLIGETDRPIGPKHHLWFERHSDHFQQIISDHTFVDNAIVYLDEFGVGILKVGTIDGAVNQLKISNSVSGSPPILEAVGGNTDISILLKPKGIGEVFGSRETMAFPLGDEFTPPAGSPLTLFTKYMPQGGTIVGPGFAEATVAPTTTSLTLDVKLNDTTIYSTKPVIGAGDNIDDGNSELTADPTTFVKGDKLEFIVNSVDTGATAAGIKMNLFFRYTA